MPQDLVSKNNGVRHTVKSSNTFATNDINLAVIIILLTNSIRVDTNKTLIKYQDLGFVF